MALYVVCLVTACGGGAEAVAEQATLSPQEEEGKRQFSLHCASCHSTEPDIVIVGPSLKGLPGRAATRNPNLTVQEYIITSILRPDEYIVDGFDNLMPATLGKTLTGEDMDAVVAYLLTLE
jgi:mono/diheme cytochrome c family protein